MTRNIKSIMLNIMRNLLESLGSEPPQVNYGLVLGKHLISLCRSNRICRSYWNAFADRARNISVTDSNTPNSPVLVTTTLSEEKCSTFLPIKEQPPTSLFISWFLQCGTGTAWWTEMPLGAGACALMGSFCYCAAQTYLLLTHPMKGKP